MEISLIIFAALGIGLGGFLKGATGAGAPIVGVPILALIFDVPTAVATFAVLNLISNIYQSWEFRSHRGSWQFVGRFAAGGAVGVAAGSMILAWLPTDALMGGLALMIVAYIALRLSRPDWALEREKGEKFAGLAGTGAGVLQGAGGISAPISVTYLNAMSLDRAELIATITVFFTVMSAFQIPVLMSLGILSLDRALMAVVAAVPLFGAMPLGNWCARRMSRQVFDRAILILLALIAVRLGYIALT